MLICLGCLKKLVANGKMRDAEAEWIRARLPTALDSCTFCTLTALCFDDFDAGDIHA